MISIILISVAAITGAVASYLNKKRLEKAYSTFPISMERSVPVAVSSAISAVAFLAAAISMVIQAVALSAGLFFMVLVLIGMTFTMLQTLSSALSNGKPTDKASNIASRVSYAALPVMYAVALAVFWSVLSVFPIVLTICLIVLSTFLAGVFLLVPKQVAEAIKALS